MNGGVRERRGSSLGRKRRILLSQRKRKRRKAKNSGFSKKSTKEDGSLYIYSGKGVNENNKKKRNQRLKLIIQCRKVGTSRSLKKKGKR